MGMCKIRMNNTTKQLCEEGLELMKEHFEKQPEDLYETTFYSDANMQLGHPEEALRAIKLLNEHNPTRIELQMRLAEAYSRSGDYVQSNATYDSIEALFGDAIQITSSKIDNYMAMNDSAGALKEMRGLLHAVADTQDGNAGIKQLRIAEGCPFVPYAGRTAGKNDARRMTVQNLIQRSMPRNNLRINMAFPDAAGDQLGILAAEVQNQDQFLCHSSSVWRRAALAGAGSVV
jgi:tetratricopeptide (TPR) repeat protein